ncbi:HpcH/HpaI aldolase/citrate lyase family protein [Pseudoduganella violacea]|uniref:Citrate lyase subunit beta/citryl-CoA lyase/(S)-citramalyl-CoA lyase n=1 Tax=Pseudoduganella violacea TaxID=1715466 RepID=A0A7W5B7M1_9BURK|nr:CoA ester lyase [Pseudoduganella violacea]MBB3118017.1 citrate lyase subunit beta/citryl-CoA lyase/(S)-citramalyl-CoA lyase [Pseudoduganella violacea]
MHRPLDRTPAAPPRAVMFLSALKAEHFDKVKRSGADICLIDLEDAVPCAHKALARARCLEALQLHGASCRFAVRINELRSREFLSDMQALLDCAMTPHMVLLPMVETAAEIDIVRALFGAQDKFPLLFALIETLNGLHQVDAIAARADGLLFGAADFAALLGTDISWENMLHARQQIGLAAARHGIVAIDTPCFDLAGPELLQRECRGARALGFHGKAAVHPQQVEIIRALFTPSQEEQARARAIVAADALHGGAIATVDGQMIGPPFVKRAKRLLRELGPLEEAAGAADPAAFAQE